MLLIWSAGLHAFCVESQLLHSALNGVLLSSFASTANPQMFALAREHADRTGRETVMFSTFLRAQISLARVIGPPLAYELAMGFSFKVMYLTAAIAFVVCGLIVWLFLPSIQRNIPVVTQPVEILPSTHRKRDTRLLFVVCSMMWAANNLYMINMPLFIIDELHLTDKLAGEMIGIAAGLEIPMMLIAGYYETYWQAAINAHCYREWNVFLRQRTHGDDSGS